MTERPAEYEDYFKSETHFRIFEIVFTQTFNEAVALATQEVGDDVHKPPGLLRAISKIQAHAAAAAHFYTTSQLTHQGAAFFRGLADQIDGKATSSMAKARSAKSRIKK